MWIKKIYTLAFTALFCMSQLAAQPYKVPVYSISTFQQPQNGEEGAFAIDNNIQTIYHSKWGSTGIPDTVDVFFTERVKSIHQIVYVPRKSGLNGVWTNVHVFYATRQNPRHFIPVQANAYVWPASNADKIIQLANPITEPAVIRFAVNSGVGNYSSCAELEFYSMDKPADASGYDCEIPTGEFASTPADIKVQILQSGSFASSFQPGENIEKSFDGNLNTLYHSSWTATTFPVTLNYRISGGVTVDYLKYIPRVDGTNGNFGKVQIYYNTLNQGQAGEFIHLMDFDFRQSGLPVKVDFPQSIKPYNIRIVVLNGSGGFASCAEMEFYTKNTDLLHNKPYQDIFADDLYASLHPHITRNEIDTISSVFYRNLALCLYQQSYHHRYRVQSYEAYPHLSTVSQQLKVGNYDAFENATGIVFASGEKAVVFARNIPDGVPVYLRVRDFADESTTRDNAWQIVNGINVFDLMNGGLAYISYFDDAESLPDIDINIATGKVNGYFHIDRTPDAEWKNLLDGENYSKIDVIGKYTHLIYDKGALRFGTPFSGLALISRYDSIVAHQRLMMGLFKYGRNVKNRQLALSGFSGGWYAGGLGIHLDLSWGVNSITNPQKLGLWGIAHEFGHINQIRPGLMWHGTVEVTTNIYSTWVTFHMKNPQEYYPRLESEVERPSPQAAPIAGGRFNGFLEDALIRKLPLKGAPNYDVFKVLVPFWQLQLYYQLAGACKDAPVLSLEGTDPGYQGVDYAHYFGTVAEMVRNSNPDNLSPGQLQLNFVSMVCDAVQEDLTEYFVTTGFLKPINRVIDDYGSRNFIITQAQVDQTIAQIKSKGYNKPASPVIHYISAHSLDAFRYRKALEGRNGQGVVRIGNQLSVQHDEWQNVVAFEVYNQSGVLLHVCIPGTGDPNNQTTTVPYPAQADKVYAVGFDGDKRLVYPVSTTSALDFSAIKTVCKISPNPSSLGDAVFLHIPYSDTDYHVRIISIHGERMRDFKADAGDLDSVLNQQIQGLGAGVYVIKLIDAQGKEWSVRMVKI
ncbi:MAG: hypothetical protein IPM26_13195 [Saprospiraceae bacterium]|nr:hypothetical protein [Saprospiraceae bacterium]